MATLSFSNLRSKNVAGIRREVLGVYTGPASYATGGDSLTPEELGLGVVEFIDFENAISSTPANRLLTYDISNETVVWIIPNTGAEVAAAVDLSTFSARFRAVGK